MPSPRTLTISADDLGMTPRAVDTLLDAAEQGSVTSISVLANAPAFEYAAEAFRKRVPHARLNAHLNLTEGKPILPASEVPHLVREDGFFRHSVLSLWLSYLLQGAEGKRALRDEVRRELDAQIRRIEETFATKGLPADGHQHVHMVPFVRDEILALSSGGRLSALRIPEEPLNLVLPALSLRSLVSIPASFLVLNALAAAARTRARAAGIHTNDAFVGVLYSGRMSLATAKAGLASVKAVFPDAKETELLFHPGCAEEGLVPGWSGDCAWHTSSVRAQERAAVMSPEMRTLAEAFRNDTLAAGPDLAKMIRYLISGGSAAATHLVMLFLFTQVFGIWYMLANVFAFCIALTASFLLQKFFTFRSKNVAKVHHQAFWYVLVQFVSLGIDTAGLYVLVQYFHIWYLLAQFFLLLTIAVGNFFIFNRIIFKHHGTEASSR